MSEPTRGSTVTKRRIVVALCAALTGTSGLAPAGAFQGGAVGGHAMAGPGQFGSQPAIGARDFGRRAVAAHSLAAHQIPFHRRFHHHRFVFYGYPVVYPVPVFGAPYAADVDEAPTYASAPDAYDSPIVSAPPVSMPEPVNTVSLAPAPPPPPSVVEYSTGRYELRGDGTTTPYTWVWIPNPPPPPSAPPPPPAGPPTDQPASLDAPPHRAELYRWTDEQGVVHLTDQLNAVPKQYRPQAKPPQPS